MPQKLKLASTTPTKTEADVLAIGVYEGASVKDEPLEGGTSLYTAMVAAMDLFVAHEAAHPKEDDPQNLRNNAKAIVLMTDGANTSAKKGETLADTARIISSYTDAIIQRQLTNGLPARLRDT